MKPRTGAVSLAGVGTCRPASRSRRRQADAPRTGRGAAAARFAGNRSTPPGSGSNPRRRVPSSHRMAAESLLWGSTRPGPPSRCPRRTRRGAPMRQSRRTRPPGGRRDRGDHHGVRGRGRHGPGRFGGWHLFRLGASARADSRSGGWGCRRAGERVAKDRGGGRRGCLGRRARIRACRGCGGDRWHGRAGARRSGWRGECRADRADPGHRRLGGIQWAGQHGHRARGRVRWGPGSDRRAHRGGRRKGAGGKTGASKISVPWPRAGARRGLATSASSRPPRAASGWATLRRVRGSTRRFRMCCWG